MFTQLHKIDALTRAIDEVVSKNRHVSLFDGDEILKKCSKKLRRLKSDIIKSGEVRQTHKLRIVKVIAMLDEYFGGNDAISEFFDDHK